MTGLSVLRSIAATLRVHGVGTVVGTILLTIRLKLAGVETSGIVSSTLRGPRLTTRGRVQIGARCAFRNERLPSSVGATAGGRLVVGERTFINEGCTIVATEQIAIGADCRIGEFVAIFDTHYHAVGPGESAKTASVSIGRNVWVSRGSLVLPGVTIGDNSVVAGHSVVTGDVPPHALVAGNPARVIRTFDDIDGWSRD